LCIARLDGADRYFLWESGDDIPDRVVLDDAGELRLFSSEAAARAAEGDELSTEPPTIYDLDALDAWCRSDAVPADCSPLLEAWNLFGDLPRDENLFAAADGQQNDLYDKLFFGCNLPAMTPPGQEYIPTWTSGEIHALKRVLLLGLAELRGRLPSSHVTPRRV
jgi:hypothetical protein